MSSQNSQKSIFSYVTDQTRFENTRAKPQDNNDNDNTSFLRFFPQTRFSNATQTVDISTELRGFITPNSKCNR